MARQRSGARAALVAGALATVLATVGCTGSGSSTGGGDRGTASPSGSASAAASPASAIGETAQPETSQDAAALFAAVPGGTGESPAFDADVAADLDKALGKVVKRSGTKGFFTAVERGRPRGVIVRQYLLCPSAFGKECQASVSDYRRSTKDCSTDGGVRVDRTVGSGKKWAAGTACVRKVTGAIEKDAVKTVFAAHRDAGAKVRKDAAFAALARDWAAQRLTEPGEAITKIDTPRERQLYARLGRLARGRTGCFERSVVEPAHLVDDRATQFLPDGGVTAVNDRRVRLGTGVARARGRLVVVFCEDIR